MYPLPDVVLFEEVAEIRLRKQNWTDAAQEGCQRPGDLVEALRKATLTTALYPNEIKQAFNEVTLDVLGALRQYNFLVTGGWFLNGELENMLVPSLKKRHGMVID